MKNNKKEEVIIKIGSQRQAKKPVFLYNNGSIVCGNFIYKGRHRESYRKYYYYFLEHANSKAKNDILDVSEYKLWDATLIYNEYMAPKWQKTMSIDKLSAFANETEIRKRIETIIPEFVRALGAKWRRIFKNSNPADPVTPKQAWQIL